MKRKWLMGLIGMMLVCTVNAWKFPKNRLTLFIIEGKLLSMLLNCYKSFQFQVSMTVQVCKKLQNIERILNPNFQLEVKFIATKLSVQILKQ